jgi:hypothetical protein
MSAAKDAARSELVLRLTAEQVAAIRLKHQRRKQHVNECAYVDLGDISELTATDLITDRTETLASET